MRKAVAALVVLAVVVGALVFVDLAARHRAQTVAAARIERQLPGSHATVRIFSFPFLGRLAVSGDVPRLHAQVTGVDAAGLPISAIDLNVTNLRVRRSSLLHGQLQLASIGRATVSATVTQAAVDHLLGVGMSFGAGTVGVGGAQLPVHLDVAGGRLELRIPSLTTLRIPLPGRALLPCVSAAEVLPGRLQLSCTTTTVPPALAGTAIRIA